MPDATFDEERRIWGQPSEEPTQTTSAGPFIDAAVDSHAEEMRVQMIRNAHKNPGGIPGGLHSSKYSMDDLLTLLEQNVDELRVAVKYGKDVDAKAADVSNHSWIVAARFNQDRLDG